MSKPSRRAVAAALLVAFGMLTGLELHGFSLAVWHRIIDRSEESEVWLGRAHEIRSDDWSVQLPLALAQSIQRPPFPTVNPAIGTGQNTLVPISAPVRHPLALFQPQWWGFFAGDDVGLAWLWWFQVLGLVGAAWLAFDRLSEGRPWLAALGAGLIALSPALQFFSFNAARFAIYAFLCAVATERVAFARRRRAITLYAALLAWSGACLGIAVYPPYQVGAIYLFLALMASFVLARARREGWQRGVIARVRSRWPLRAALLVAAAAVQLAAVDSLLTEAREAVLALSLTAYPGQRVSLGGDHPLWRTLTGNLLLSLWTGKFGALLKIHGAVGFWLSFPPISAALLARRWRLREPLDGASVVLLAVCAALALYAQFGVPEWLARATGLSRIPAGRSIFALGLADAALLVRFLAVARGPTPFAVWIALGWIVSLGAAAAALAKALPTPHPLPLTAATLLNGGVVLGLLRGVPRARSLASAPALAAAAMILALASSTIWFNPLTRGGSDYLRDNPLARAILRLDGEAGGESRWAVFGEAHQLGNYIASLGVASVNGTHTVPQFGLWKVLDPTGRSRKIYNRYAHVRLLPGHNPEPEFQLRTQALVIVRLDPRGRELAQLGVTHVLLHDPDPGWLPLFNELELVHRVDRNWLYRLRDPQPSPPLRSTRPSPTPPSPARR